MIGKGSFRKLGLALLSFLLAGLFLVNIVDAEQNRCLPDWSLDAPILIDEDMGRIEFASGDSFSIEASYRYASSCKNYAPAVFTWQALKNNIATNDIVFSDSHAKKTTATVVLGAQTGDVVTIRGILTFADEPNGQRSEREINVFIVDKPPAPKIVPRYGPVESRRLKVNIWESEVYGSSNNFIASCSFMLKDMHGKVVDTDKKDTTFGKVMLPAQLEVKSPDSYELTVKCLDSHGSAGTVMEYLYANVTITRQNTPVMIVNKTMNCYLGKDCVIDFSQTNAFGKSIKVEYYDITNGDNKNALAIPCGTQACRLNFTRPGVYTIKLEARFLLGSDENSFRYSDKSEVAVLVTVTAGQGYQKPQLTPVATQQPLNQPVGENSYIPIGSAAPGECGKDYECPQTSSLGIFATIIAFVIVARLKNKKIKSLY